MNISSCFHGVSTEEAHFTGWQPKKLFLRYVNRRILFFVAASELWWY